MRASPTGRTLACATSSCGRPRTTGKASNATGALAAWSHDKHSGLTPCRGSGTVDREVGLGEHLAGVGMKARPTSVSPTRRLVRLNSRAPSSLSSMEICLLSAGCTMCRCPAARPKCGSSATATEYSRCRYFIRTRPLGEDEDALQ